MKTTLSLYLMRESTGVEGAVSDMAHDGTRHSVVMGPDHDGVLFTATSRNDNPSWVRLIGDDVDPSIDVASEVYGGALCFFVDGELLVATFGVLGRYLVEKTRIVPRFGLRVVVNAVPEDALRAVDSQKFDTVFRSIQEQSVADAEARQFGLDVEQDLVKNVVGRPRDVAFATLAGGGDKLSLKGDYAIHDFHRVGQQALRFFRSGTYKKAGFSWVDNLERVVDQDTVELLDLELDDLLADPARRHLVELGLPATLDFEDDVRFAYNRSGHYFLLSVASAEQEYGGVLSTDFLRGRRVRVESRGVSEAVSLYRCLIAHVDVHAGESFFLADGVWYRVDKGWVRQTDASIAGIPERSYGPDFDPGVHTEIRNGKSVPSEGAWCQDAAALIRNGVCLDRALVSVGGGRSRVEFCDIFDGRRIIHAKRYHGSATMSHLFAQARASAEGWLRFDSAFRTRVNALLPATHQLADPLKRPDPRRFEIVLVLINPPVVLPFLSRVNLRRLKDELDLMGVELSLGKVAQVPLKVLKPKGKPKRRRKA